MSKYSRRGCATCRGVHVKCDEQRPGCSRCINRGLSCPGYQRPLRWSQKYETGAKPISPVAVPPPSDRFLGAGPSTALVTASSHRLSASLYDDCGMFIDSYSVVLAKVLSIYDGLFNPFSAAALSTWRRSSLLFSVFKFFARIYQSGCNSNLQIRVAVDEARLGVLSQLSASLPGVRTSVAVEKPEVLLVVNMFGLSSSWYDMSDPGLEHYTAATNLIQNAHGMKLSSYYFYEQFLVYWWMMLSFASGSDACDLPQPPTLRLRSLVEPQVPHPLTGVSPESQLLLGMVGRLIVTQRKAFLEQSITRTDSLLISMENIQEARDLERRLLTLQLPALDTILDPGDPHTSVQDLLYIAQAYRTCGLILLYQAYPDLVLDETFCGTSWDSAKFTVNADRQRQGYLMSLAFDALNLLGQISPTSGTRTIEAILLVIVSGELSLHGSTPAAFLGGTTDKTGSYPDSDARLYNDLNGCTPMAVLEARAVIIARFERIQAILPFKTIHRMKSLVTETWSLMDSGSYVFWADLLIKNKWQFLMI